ncbi:DHA2 family efflux MFS transporter permease subunit [Amycolatopsis azurea]|uniref:DHA2 family efflux MFS transporter permease subunit n=1 Tax=Amycolatopsis azurea TaxID=36819 RepID=UPI003822CE0A
MSVVDRASTAGIGPLTTVIVLGGFMAGIDTSLVNVGLATIAEDLHATLVDAQWATSGYLLALAAALPASAWLQHRLGASRLWLIALVAFMAASLLCAVAPNLPLLIIARAVQGVSGGLLVPTGQSIVARAVSPDRMGRTMATAGLVIMAAPAIGPALGGLLIDTMSWRWLFAVNVPIGVLAALLALRVLPKDTANRTAKLDLLGLTLLSTGLPALLVGLTNLGSPGTQGTLGLILAVLGALLLAAFAGNATRRDRSSKRTPLLELSLFRRMSYATAQITLFFTGLSLFGGLILLPLYYETLRGLTVTHTGLLLLAYGLGAMTALPIGGRITDRYGAGITCVIGLTIAMVATVPFVFLPQNTSLVTVELLQALRGIGVGLAGIPAMTAAIRAASDHLADATTTANIIQRVGGSLGSAIIVIVLAGTPRRLAGFQAAHAILVAAAAIALIAAVALAISERRAPRAAASPQASTTHPAHYRR